MADQKQKSGDSEFHPYPLVSPRFWHGMRTGHWWSLLAKHGFRISPSRLHYLLGVSIFTPWNDVLGLLQHAIHGKKIASTSPLGPQIFVLGHWRSGTTYLHELLQLDDRFASPTTYQCFAPWHFLMSEWFIARYMTFLLPSQRPMDNMKAGWDLPQEDEFALMNLGAPTSYTRIAFPKDPVDHPHALDSDQFTDEELASWKANLKWFVSALTYHTNKPLILKSPPHTGRVGLLAEMFPEARFIHIVRDPRKLYPSTVRLWQALDFVQSLQVDKDPARIEKMVLESLPVMYKAFEAQRSKVAENRLVEVRYEDLVKSPNETLRSIYEKLDLGDYSTIQPKVEQRVSSEKNYQTNRFSLDAETEQKVLSAWGDYAKRYGYA